MERTGGAAQAQTKYARSGELAIAYRTLSDHGPDLLVVPGYVTHAEANEHAPPVASFLKPLTRFARVTVFDKRGTGMSDRDLGSGAFDDRMDDLRAVMDDAGIERANVMGWSEGVPLSILFAATHPDRVHKLVLYAGFAKAVATPDYPVGYAPEVMDALIRLIEEQWGTGKVAPVFIQDWPAGPDGELIEMDMAARHERLMCTPRGAAELLRSNAASDVRHALPLVRQPTLVIHATGDPAMPVAQGRYLAEHLPNATFVEIDGDFHLTWDARKYEPIHAAVEEFLTGRPPDPVFEDLDDRVLATVLLTDIVDSTPRAVAEGDRRWLELLDEHDRRTREIIERHRGRVIKTTGDGALAIFDGPARAIRAAASVRDAVWQLGIEIRCGLHTGEVELRGEEVGGLAVHLCARVNALARTGEVLVSRTVADLVAGSGISFEDRGEHELKGVPGAWRLLAAQV